MFRCRIPECEQPDSNDFYAEWTKYAIPNKNGRPENCLRYEYIETSSNDGTCGEHNFNKSREIRCDSIFIKNSEERLVTRVRG